MTALVIEDEPIVLGVIRAMLQRDGFTVDAAQTAAAARCDSSDRQLRFDLVVVDRRLPDALGIEVALEIRNSRPDVLIILTSGTPTSCWEAREKSLLSRLPCDGLAFLRKPFTLQKFTETVHELLSRKGILQAGVAR